MLGAQLGLEAVTERAGPHVDHERRGVDVADAATGRTCRGSHRRRSAPMHRSRPDRPPAAVTGILAMSQTWSTSATCVRIGRLARRRGPSGELALERPRHRRAATSPATPHRPRPRRCSPRRSERSRSRTVPVTPTRPRVGWGLAAARPVRERRSGSSGHPGPGSMSPARSGRGARLGRRPGSSCQTWSRSEQCLEVGLGKVGSLAFVAARDAR